MWIFFALLAPLLFAIVHVMDSYCVEEIFEKPWMGMVISSITSMMVLLTIPFVMPFYSGVEISLNIFALAILAGVLIQINQAIYFEALNNSDASIVSSYWNLVPAITPLASYILLGDLLGIFQYVGILIIIFGSYFLSKIDKKISFNSNAFTLIFIASILQVTAIFIMNFVFDSAPYYLVFIGFNIGLTLTGLFPLLFTDAKAIFCTNIKSIYNNLKILIAIEIVNLFAYASLQAALKFGHPSLVTALEASTPAYVFLISLIMIKYTKISINKNTFYKKTQKLSLIFLMIVGIFLLNP